MKETVRNENIIVVFFDSDFRYDLKKKEIE